MTVLSPSPSRRPGPVAASGERNGTGGTIPSQIVSARQRGAAHQSLVDRPRALPAFADRPDDERLTAAHVAGGEQLGNRGLVVLNVGGDVAARIERHARLLEQARLARPQEAHSQ